MEIFFKKYFWTVNLLVIAVCSFLLARTVNTFVASHFISVPKAAKPKPPKLSSDDKEKNASAILGRNIFNSEMGPIEMGEEQVVEEEPIEEVEDSGVEGDPVESDIKAELIATVVANVADWSLATVQDIDAKESYIYRIGSKLLDEAPIVDIQLKRIVFRRNNRLEYLTLGNENKKPALKTPGKPVAEKDNYDEGIKKTGEDQYLVSKDLIESQVSNLSKLATQARIVPSFRDGKPNGFKLFAIRPGSLYHKLGMNNGDIIQRVNGNDINTPDKALSVFQKLRESKNITIDLLRRGKPKSLDYTIQ